MSNEREFVARWNNDGALRGFLAAGSEREVVGAGAIKTGYIVPEKNNLRLGTLATLSLRDTLLSLETVVNQIRTILFSNACISRRKNECEIICELFLCHLFLKGEWIHQLIEGDWFNNFIKRWHIKFFNLYIQFCRKRFCIKFSKLY